MCGKLHSTNFEDFIIVDMEEYLSSIDKDMPTSDSPDTLSQFEIADLEAACPSGQKPCGRMSDPNKFVCFDSANPCPINSIVINDQTEPPDDTYVSLFFGDGFFLHYSKDKIQNYLVSGDFRIGGDKFCMHPTERMSGFDNSETEGGVLEECKRGVWAKDNDEVMVVLDNQDKKLIYQYNNLTDMYDRNLLYANIMKDQDLSLNLFNKPFMYFKDSCKNEDQTKLEKIRSREYQNLTFQTIVLVLIIVSSIGFILTILYLLIFWKTNGSDTPVTIPSLLVAGILLIFLLPIFGLCIGWFVVFCYQQATQDFMQHCFDSVNKHYWSSIRLGTTEPLIVYLLLFPLFFVALFLYYKLYKEFKENQQYFETKLDTQEQLDLQKIRDSEKQIKEPMQTNTEENTEENNIPAPIIAKGVKDRNKSKSRSPSRSRSSSRNKPPSEYRSPSDSPKKKKKYKKLDSNQPPPPIIASKSPSPQPKKRSLSPSPEPMKKRSLSPSPEPMKKRSLSPSPESKQSISSSLDKSKKMSNRENLLSDKKSSRKVSTKNVSSHSVDSQPPVGLIGMGVVGSNKSNSNRRRKKKRRRQIMKEKDEVDPKINTYRKPRAVEPEPAKQHKRANSDEEGFDFTEYYNNIIKDDEKNEKKNKFTDKVKNQGQKYELSKFMSKLKPKNKNPGLKKKPTFMNDIYSIVGNKGQSRFHRKK